MLGYQGVDPVLVRKRLELSKRKQRQYDVNVNGTDRVVPLLNSKSDKLGLPECFKKGGFLMMTMLQPLFLNIWKFSKFKCL